MRRTSFYMLSNSALFGALLRCFAWAVLIGLIFFSPISAQQLVVAEAVKNIEVDGDFSDWPTGIPSHSFQSLDNQLKAVYRIAYDLDHAALYIALEVSDATPVLDRSSTASWNTQDGSEIYLATKNEVESQYALWGDRLIGASEGVEVGLARQGDIQHYEWRITPGTHDMALREGLVLHLGIAVNDKAPDGSFRTALWGSGTAKAGQVILVPQGTTTSILQGVVNWSSRTAIARTTVAVHSTTHADWRWTLQTDRQGHFAARLPQDIYRVFPLLDQATQTAPIELKAEGLELDLRAQSPAAKLTPAGRGKTIRAGEGTTIDASFGIQKDLWRTYGLPDGLASTVVDAIHQDHNGYLWIGTQGGISRYDGEHFTTFTTADGLAYNGVSAIAEDAQGNLWFGTWGGGISRYDGEHFTTFTTADGLANDVVLSIFNDRHGNLWFGTQGGACRYDGEDFTTFTTRHGLAHDKVSAIAEDANGDLWFGTWGGGVSRYDGDNDQGTVANFTNYTTADGLANGEVSNITVGANKELWFATQGGVSLYNGERFTSYTTRDGLPHDAVSDVAIDRYNQLWCSTWEGGVSRFDGKKFTTFTSDEGLAHDEVSVISQDRDGNLWFGTWGGGLSRYDGVNFTHFDETKGLTNNAVSTLIEDSTGRIWVGTANGLSRHENGTFTNFTPSNGLIHGTVNALFEDRSGQVWIGTQGGLCTSVEQELRCFTKADGLAHDWISSITQSHDGNLWFGTWGGGLSRYDGEHFTTYTTADGLSHDWINAAFTDREGTLWFGTKGGGLSRYDGEHFTTYTSDDGLAANWIWSIAQDDDGALWLGTDNGVCRFDGTDFTTLTSKNGLSSDKVNAVLQDQRQRMWFGTRGGGVTLYDGQVMQSLLVRDGMTDNIVTALLEDRNGAIWIGTGRGLTTLQSPVAPAQIHLTDVVVDQRYGPVEQVSISSTQDYLAFEFQGVSFKTRPGALIYRYRLAGIDTDWQLTNLGRVEYHNLPLGYYTFEVAAIDRDLQLSTHPVLVVVRIHPPYGDIALYATLFVVLLGLFWSAGQIVQRNRRLEVARKTAEAAQHEADEANQSKSDFLANMSHEIRTPMNAIIGMAHLALRTNLDAKQLDYIEKIQGSGQHLLGLINDILDFSKIEAGKLNIERVDFSLYEIMDNVAALIGPKAADKGLEFLFDLDAGLPSDLRGDPLRLGQIIINYANNSVKFTETGQILVRVSHSEVSDGNLLLRFEVEDTGIGLSPEQQNKLFQSFQQADTSTTRKFGGTGLGLAISKNLAELMGGQVGVESALGQGSTFWFTAHLEMGVPKEKTDILEPDLRNRRVLVVDDNAQARQIAVEMLSAMTLRADEAPSGERALELIQAATDTDPYDLIFIDWHMPPGIDGVETIRRLHALNLSSSPRPIMVTAYGRTEVMEEAHQVGIDITLVKPVNPSHLYDAAVHALRNEVGWVAEARDRVSVTEGLDLSSIQGAHLLLVEDNEINQQVAIELLRDAGFYVELAENGQIGVDKVGAGDYDLVLMDMQMPVMDGITATLAIRSDERFADLSIVAMTANAMAGDRDRCLAAGMNDHVAKPIDPVALFKALLKWVTPGERELPPPADEAEHTSSNSEMAEGTADALDKLGQVEGLDTATGIQRVGGKRDFYEKLIRQFCDGEQVSAAVTAQNLLTENDRSGAERAAHSLKGVAATLGANELARRAQGLEEAIHNEGEIDPHLDAAQAELDRLLPLLQDALGREVTSEESAEEGLDLAPDQVEKLPQLLENIQPFQERIDTLKATLDISEIEDFSSDILGLAEAADYPPLAEWAKRLAEATSMFDISAMSTELEQFAVQVDAIRQILP
ncbi:MAG: two-component system sensor histidine kinase/response regulator [Candidatus Latescibacterota bacterium]|jgi:two-component system sensor histidine kinase/response regulator